MTTSGAAPSILVGTYQGKSGDKGSNVSALRLVCDAPELTPHLDKLWLRDWIAERHGGDSSEEGLSESPHSVPANGDAIAGEDSLRRHTLICGSAGSGKSRLALHLAVEQLRAGCSVVAIDLKDQTVRHLLYLAEQAGFPRERVLLMMPGLGRPPAWNPLDAEALGIPAEEAVRQFAEVVEEVGGTGAQIADLLSNTLLLATAHRLSLYEAVQLLRDDAYRNGLLMMSPHPNVLDEDTYAEVRAFFENEFGRMAAGERKVAAGTVLRRLRELVKDPYLRAMLCSDRPSFRLTSLWQGEPQLVLVHLDENRLGRSGATLIGTLLARQLFMAASRAGGHAGGNPVVLFVDEIGRCQSFLGKAPDEILAFSRSYDLRVLAACQFLSQLEPRFREGLLTNTAVQAFFRLGPADARFAAEFLAEGAGTNGGSGNGGTAQTLELEADAKGRQVEVSYMVTDAAGRMVRLSDTAWRVLSRLPSYSSVNPAQTSRVQALENLLAVSGMPLPAMAAAQPLGSLLSGLREGDWSFTGSDTVGIVVRFPRPKVRVLARRERAQTAQAEAQRFKGRISRLETRRAILNLPGVAEPGEIAVVDVPDDKGASAYYLAAALSTGQADDEARKTLARRKARIQEVAGSPSQEQHGGASVTAKSERLQGKPALPSRQTVNSQTPTSRTARRRPAVVAPVPFAEVDDSA